MAWTRWRKIAEGNDWYPDELDNDGPACYELGTGGPRGGNIQTHYVGETKCEQDRIASYARSGSHLAWIVRQHLRDGWCLYYHAIALPSKAAAVAMQNNLLSRFEYDRNDLLNH